MNRWQKSLASAVAIEAGLVALFAFSGFGPCGPSNPLGLLGYLGNLFPGILVADWVQLLFRTETPNIVLFVGGIVVVQTLFYWAVCHLFLFRRMRY